MPSRFWMSASGKIEQFYTKIVKTKGKRRFGAGVEVVFWTRLFWDTY